MSASNSTCSNCGKEPPVGEKFKFCTACKSRSYCDESCQLSHWKKSHKKECKSMKETRAEMEGNGMRCSVGIPPSMTTKNVHTGRSNKNMKPPTSKEHQQANMRQSISSIIGTINKNHPRYISAAYAFSHCLSGVDFQLALDMIYQEEFGSDPLTERIMFGYRYSEYDTLTAEMKNSGDRRALREKGIMLIRPDNVTESDFDASLTLKALLNQDGMDETSAVTDRYPPINTLVLPFSNMLNIHEDLEELLLNNGHDMEHIDLTGTCMIVDNTMLDIISEKCSMLEFFCFGIDNRYFMDYCISIGAVIRMVRGCPKLRMLRILHRLCGGGSNNNSSKKMDRNNDPSNGAGKLSKALGKEGFVLKCVEGANECKKEISLEDHSMFWRADCEDGLISASWYGRFDEDEGEVAGRGEQQRREFYRKHYYGWQ